MPEKTLKKLVSCPCGSRFLQLRADKRNSVGLATCPICQKHYLLLDSGDYWYDVIQERYPRATKCRCGCARFTVEIEYEYCDDDVDIGFVSVDGKCADCQKLRNILEIKVDYAPTEHLVKTPLVECAVPKLKYDLRNLTGFWKKDDTEDLVSFLTGELNLSAWEAPVGQTEVSLRKADTKRCLVLVRTAEVYRLAFGSDDQSHHVVKVGDWKAYERLWRHHEFLMLFSPLLMNYGEGREGDLYRLECATQFIEDYRIVNKSRHFRETVSRLEKWLASRLVSSRGDRCFDRPEELHRLFGNEYG